jgi:hypothetical protein
MDVGTVDRVRCLDCGAKYVKPVSGGTLFENPGCPRCAYVGWVATVRPEPHRFVLDPLPLCLDPQH